MDKVQNLTASMEELNSVLDGFNKEYMDFVEDFNKYLEEYL